MLSRGGCGELLSSDVVCRAPWAGAHNTLCAGRGLVRERVRGRHDPHLVHRLRRGAAGRERRGVRQWRLIGAACMWNALHRSFDGRLCRPPVLCSSPGRQRIGVQTAPASGCNSICATSASTSAHMQCTTMCVRRLSGHAPLLSKAVGQFSNASRIIGLLLMAVVRIFVKGLVDGAPAGVQAGKRRAAAPGGIVRAVGGGRERVGQRQLHLYMASSAHQVSKAPKDP